MGANTFNLGDFFTVDSDIVLSVIVRSALMTIFVLIAIRWMGKKGLGQLNMYELIILIGLGTAIGDPMLYTEISVVQAFSAIIVVLVLFKVIDYLTMRSKKFAKVIIPKPTLIVKDGALLENGLVNARMSESEYQSLMRLHGIRDISQIELSYLEPNGQVSFIKKKENG